MPASAGASKGCFSRCEQGPASSLPRVGRWRQGQLSPARTLKKLKMERIRVTLSFLPHHKQGCAGPHARSPREPIHHGQQSGDCVRAGRQVEGEEGRGGKW